jgi:thioredoxin-like negative regulator of GroEL
LKKASVIALAILCSVATLFGAEDWRGTNRIAGVIVDKATGKPVPNAKLKLRIQKGDKGGPDVTADGGGKWAMLGLAAGGWNIDVSAPGYETRQMSMSMAEGQRIPTMKIELTAVATSSTDTSGGVAEVPKEEVKIGGQTVSKDIADAVEAGNTALGAKNYKDAISNYEKASAALPAFMPIKLALARAYYGDGQLKKAIAVMDDVVKADPANSQTSALLANMLMEDGQVDRAKGIIEKLPEGATDINTLLNAGIALMNKKQPAAAETYFSKAISKEPQSHLGYYYRGLAYIQQNKPKEAKPDLLKVIELAPDSPEAKDAKEYLKSIK